MEIGLEIPDDDEIAKIVEVAYGLAVTRFGPNPPYEEVRKIFFRLLFDGERLLGGELE